MENHCCRTLGNRTPGSVLAERWSGRAFLPDVPRGSWQVRVESHTPSAGSPRSRRNVPGMKQRNVGSRIIEAREVKPSCPKAETRTAFFFFPSEENIAFRYSSSRRRCAAGRSPPRSSYSLARWMTRTDRQRSGWMDLPC